MKPVIKGFEFDQDSNDKFQPEDPSCFFTSIRLIIGPDNEEGEEIYDVFLVTPKWMESNYKQDRIHLGMNKIIVKEFDLDKILVFLNSYLERCAGKNWKEVSYKLRGLGVSEFDDFLPSDYFD
jgi:hypothetical protein